MELEKAYKRINDFIGDDRKQLSNCATLYQILTKEKEEIEQKIHDINKEVPVKIADATVEIQDLCSEVSTFTKDLQKSLHIYEGDVSTTFEELSSFAARKKEYCKELHYLKLLKCIENTTMELRRSYSEGSWDYCISIYSFHCLLLHKIHNSQCSNLVNYLKSVILYWHKLMKEKLTTEFEQLQKTINWPFVKRNKTISVYPSDDMKPKFQRLTKLLIEVELPEEMKSKPIVTSSLLVDFPVPSLPVFLLLEPLRKRFVFHFRGTKETNRSDKPEWMFSQILTWVKEHEIFLINWVQPVYRGLTNNVKVEFISGLVKLVTEKLHADLLHLQYDDELFTHTLDETLGFHRELSENYGYPTTRASVLSVLTQAQLFVKWINMERKCAEKRMDNMLNSSTAWNIVTEDETHKVTECAEKFVILLSTITDRYSSLPQPGHRMQFLDLQIDLIDEFRLRLVQLKRDDYNDVLSSDLTAILNTLHYLSSVLMEWETTTHFILLNHFKTQINNEELASSTSVFSEVLSFMNHFIDELIKEICTSVTLEVSAKSRAYRKDRWNIMPVMNLETELSLTISGCTMFQALTTKLHQMKNIISPAIFKHCWRFVADQLCKLLIDDVILVNMFSKGGAQQIQFDVRRNILPLFAQFTSKPEAYFKPVMEACDLLCLDTNIKEDTIPFETSALNKHQVKTILSRRLGRTIFSSID